MNLKKKVNIPFPAHILQSKYAKQNHRNGAINVSQTE
jgi:hypothetical protein